MLVILTPSPEPSEMGRSLGHITTKDACGSVKRVAKVLLRNSALLNEPPKHVLVNVYVMHIELIG